MKITPFAPAITFISKVISLGKSVKKINFRESIKKAKETITANINSALKSASSNPKVVIMGAAVGEATIGQVDTPAPGPADVIGILVGVTLTTITLRLLDVLKTVSQSTSISESRTKDNEGYMILRHYTYETVTIKGKKVKAFKSIMATGLRPGSYLTEPKPLTAQEAYERLGLQHHGKPPEYYIDFKVLPEEVVGPEPAIHPFTEEKLPERQWQTNVWLPPERIVRYGRPPE
jgi:hypothetical protein